MHVERLRAKLEDIKERRASVPTYTPGTPLVGFQHNQQEGRPRMMSAVELHNLPKKAVA